MDTLTLYYDGKCPLCMAEIHFLQGRNQRQLLHFVDVSAASYDETRHQVSCSAALESMHARTGSGELLTGVAVFAQAYRRAGLPKLAWLLSRPLLTPGFNFGYRFFARHRHRISSVIGPTLLKLAQRHRKQGK